MWLFLVCIALLFPGVCFAEFDTDPFLDQRVKLDAPPTDSINEHIDPFSGNMQIVQTDLHLPGNGGLDLSVMRTYNSVIWKRRLVVNLVNLALRDSSPLGTGWTMHMGLLRDPDKNGTQWGGNPILELPDGTKQIFNLDKNDTSRLISKDFWTLKTIAYGTAYEVKSPQGIVYTFNYSVTAGSNAGYLMRDSNVKVAQTTKIQNPAGTAAITIKYQMVGANFSYIQTITDSLNRVVIFNYDTSSPQNRLTSITTGNRTISYGYTTKTPDVFLLATVTPPVGNSWQYDYEANYELTGVFYPSGGKNTYIYNDINFYTGDNCSIPYRVVTQKQTSGTNIPSGTWSYVYNSGSPNTTVISGPSVTETHKFYGWGNGSITGGNVWKVGLPISKDYNFNGATLSESFNWTAGSSISNTQISNINWGCSGFLVADAGVFPPLLSSKSVTRDGKTYTATNSNFNIYGDPQTVIEVGDISRTKSLNYWTNSTKNIVKNKPQALTVSSNVLSGASNSSWTYDTNSGNPTNITHDGVTTTYAYNSTDGNLRTITNANNKTTSYEWSNGRISKAANPIYSVSRVINTDGTIKSETNGRGYTTSYTYDNNLRITGVTPPIGNSTIISYPADNSYRQETRGSYWIKHNYDGFARPFGSVDSKGVSTSVAYKAYGVKDYSDSNVGEKTTFDYFGRPVQALDKAGYSDSYSYSPVGGYTAVTVTDKNSKTSVHTYYAFGNPDEKHLMSVKDQAGTTTSYNRNILGNVTKISQGSVIHNFYYNDPQNRIAFLTSEDHPETGTISYGRDNVGNMTSKTNATGTKTYVYDDINRLTKITSGSNTILFGYDNADNRSSMSYPGGSASFVYDTANRLTQKNETISGKSYINKYSYDNNDNVQTITYPSNRLVTYGYNGNNQITSITGFGGKVLDFVYDKEFLKSFAYYNGSNVKTITTNLTYNSRFLPDTNIAGSAVSLKYGYDTRGNTTSIINNISSSKNQTLGYDDLSRLTSFAGAWGSGSYTYDSYGSRKSKTVAGTASSTYSLINNRLSSVTGGEAATYTYNGNGALNGGTWNGSNYTLGYDAFDNLANYKAGSTTLANYAYDGDGMRVLKSAGGVSTVYHYGRSNQMLSETKSDGNLIAEYIYMNGKLAVRIVNDGGSIPPVSGAPPNPSNVQVQSISPTTLKVTWVDNSTNETGFEILRGSKGSGPNSIMIVSKIIVGPNVTTFIDPYTTTTGTYIYRIRAFNGTEFSPTYSTAVFTRKAAATATVLKSSSTNSPYSLDAVESTSLAPKITLSTLNDGAATRTKVLNIAGNITLSGSIKSLTVNGVDAMLINNHFSQALSLQPGVNEIKLNATDNNGISTNINRIITLDKIATVIGISTPPDNCITSKPYILVSGITSEKAVVKVEVVETGKTESTQISGTEFSAPVYLQKGINTINITATDLAGNSSVAKRSVIFDNQGPTLSVTEPAEDIEISISQITISGSISDTLSESSISILCDGKTYNPAIVDGKFSQKLTFAKENHYAIFVTATDLAGNKTIAQRNVIFKQKPTNKDAAAK